MKWVSFLGLIAAMGVGRWAHLEKSNTFDEICAAFHAPERAEKGVWVEAESGGPSELTLWGARVRFQDRWVRVGNVEAPGLPAGTGRYFGRLRCRLSPRNPSCSEPWVGNGGRFVLDRVFRVEGGRGRWEHRLWKRIFWVRARLVRDFSKAPWLSALIRATWTGEMSAFSWEVREEYRRAGLSHLIALSGQHFLILSFLLLATSRLGARALAKYCPLTFNRAWRFSRASIFFLSACVLLGVSHGQATVWRALQFLAAFGVVRACNVSGSSFRALLLSAAFTAICAPGFFSVPGFVISWIASVGIFLLGGGSRAALLMPFWVAPVILFYFGSANLYSPLFNALCSNIWSFVLLPAGFLLPLFGPFFSWEMLDGALAKVFAFQLRTMEGLSQSGWVLVARLTALETSCLLALGAALIRRRNDAP